LEQRRVGRLSTVRQLELSIGVGEFFGVEHRLGAAPHQFGPVGSEVSGEGVESFDEIVVELNEYFASGNDHMVRHMVMGQSIDFERPRQPVSEPSSRLPSATTAAASLVSSPDTRRYLALRPPDISAHAATELAAMTSAGDR
jgi:hypothetical protein